MLASLSIVDVLSVLMLNTSMGDASSSPTDIAASKFAVHARKTIKLITSLRALGLVVTHPLY